MNDVETKFNALYQRTLAFYENAMNGDKTHPFVLFKIKQLRLKKSNFKKVKELDNEMQAAALRTILLEDLQTFVEDIKEYELKMKAIKEARKTAKPAPTQKKANSYSHEKLDKNVNNSPRSPRKPVKQPKSNQKYLRSMNFKNNNSPKKKGKK